MVLQLTPPTDLGEQETTICKTQNALVKKLAEIADKYRYDTPQVFILDPQTAAALIKGRKSQRYEYLIDKEVTVVNNMLTYLFNKANDKGEYGTYIINEEMGTGTDFKTSSEIESKGGLVLVFGIKPTETSTFEQLSCRVGRIFNKSRRFYIIQDVDYKGSNRDYLKYQLKMLRQKECEEARALLSKLKPDISNFIEVNGESEDDQQAESLFVDADSEDIEMEDDTESKNSYGEITQSEKSNNNCENDKSFEPKQLNNEFRQANQTSKKQQKVGSKRREQKRSNKSNSKLNKVVQQQQEKTSKNGILTQKETQEIHKYQQVKTNNGQICGQIIDTDDEESKRCWEKCNCNQQKKQYKGDGSNLEIISSTQNRNVLNVEQFLRNQCEVAVDQTSEVVLAHSSEKVNTQSQEIDDGQIQSLKIDQKVNKELKITCLDQNKSATQQKVQVVVQQVKSYRGKKETDVQLKTQNEEVDALYFKNYGLPEVQQEMLDDKVRLEAYKRAIDQACKGMTVLDLGCGTGILSLYALQAGAKKVIGIDNANIEGQLNGELATFGDKFQFIKKAAENVDEEEIGGKVDVIISEWMGYFLLYENMIDSYICCISKFLKPNGITIPSEATIFLRAADIKMKNHQVQQQSQEKVGCAKIVVNEECKNEEVISEHSIIKEFKFQVKITNPLKKGFKSKFNIKMRSFGMFNALIGSFQVKLGDFYLSTSPEMELTHWKHSIFFINKPVAVKPDDVIDGTMFIQTAANNHRNLVVEITHSVKGKQGSTQEEVFTFE